VDTETLM